MMLARGNVKGFEHDRMVRLFSMMDGDKEISCAVSSLAMDDLEHGVKAKPISATTSSCGCVTGSNNAHRANSLPGSLRGRRQGSSCGAWTFADEQEWIWCSCTECLLLAVPFPRRWQVYSPMQKDPA